MSERRQDRIYQAKRSGLVARIAHAVGPERAETLMAAWECEADSLGLPRDSQAFWAEVEPWMAKAATPPVRPLGARSTSSLGAPPARGARPGP
jgi:hypothetical protein